MKTRIWLGILIGLSFLSEGAKPALLAQTTNTEATPPPSAPPKRTAEDLEKLVGPLALYPDQLIATMLPASVYPLEIVQAARFVTDTNNIAKLDEQPWDDNVKAVARVPDAIKKMNDDLPWTIELGEAFLAQDKDVMDAIQSMRGKAQKAGTLQTTPQQIVTVTNIVVMQTNTTQVVTVTNQVVQIQPANPQVVYVPSYNPTTVYYPPPSYVYNPVAPLVTFTAGVAMGAIIANNCDWFHGGCYHGGDVDIDIDRDVNRERNVNRNSNVNRSSTQSANRTGQKWQPDQSRLGKSGSPSTQASSREARGWSSGSASTRGASGSRPTTGTAGSRPSTGSVGSRPTTGTAANRPSTGTTANRPTTGSSAPRSSASTSQFQNRSSSPSAASQPRTSPSASSRSGGGGGGSSAFSGASSGGGGARASSSRGAASRGGGGGGGARGGGGRR